MFGKGDEEKKKQDELKKAMDEQLKLEKKAMEELKHAADKPAAGGSVAASLQNIGSAVPGPGKPAVPRPPEKPPAANAGAGKRPAALPSAKPAPAVVHTSGIAKKASSVKAGAKAAAPREKKRREEKPPAKRKESPSEIEKLKRQLETQRESIKDLEDEKADALKKGEELAGLIEDLSAEAKEAKAAPAPQPAQQAPPAPDMSPKIAEIEQKTAEQMKALKDAIAAMTKSKEEEEEGEEEVAVSMKKMFDKRMKELTDKLDETRVQPAPGTQPEGRAKGDIAGGLMAMGGGVEFQKDLDGVKKSLKDIATLLDAFKEEAENRFMAIDRELETVERVPNLEDKIEQFERKLGPENVERLRSLISAADDLKDEVIPLVVKRVLDEKMEPHAKGVKSVLESQEKADKKMDGIISEADALKKDIKAIYKFDTRISRLEELTDGVKQLIAELRTSLREMDKAHMKEMDGKMRELFPKIVESEGSAIRKEFAGRFGFVDDKVQSIENMAAEVQREIGELSALKGRIDNVEDGLEAAGEAKDKITASIEALRSRDKELADRIRELQTPSEVITELDNKTKDILDIREFFVRRANGLEERINQLDERAIPTKKLHEKVENISAAVKEMQEAYKALESRMAAEKREFEAVIRQHAAEKRMLEEKLREQKARVSTLLREFR